jgi:hypothetical protein
MSDDEIVTQCGLAKDGLPSYRIDHIYSQRRTAGQAGTGIHGGPKARAGGSQFFDFKDGRFYNGLLVVAFELEETASNGGGLCCVPASKKKTHTRDPDCGTVPALFVLWSTYLLLCSEENIRPTMTLDFF